MKSRRIIWAICLVPLAFAATPNPNALVEPEPDAQQVSDISSAVAPALRTALNSEDVGGVTRAFAPAIASNGTGPDVVEAFYSVAINSISPAGGPDTPGIAATFCSGLKQTPAIPQSSISAAFASSISHDIQFFTERHTNSYGGGPTLGVSLLIANSCGQDAAIRSGLLQAQASGVGLINLPFDLQVFLAVNTFDPAALQPVTTIVNDVLGATASTVAQAGNNATAVGGLLLNSAFLAQAGGLATNGSAAAQQIAQATSKLSSQAQTAAYTQGIKEGLQAYSGISPQTLGYTNQNSITQLAGSIAILVDAAEVAKQGGAVSQAFAQAGQGLSISCDAEIAARNISSATSQAISSAIASAGGSSCNNS